MDRTSGSPISNLRSWRDDNPLTRWQEEQSATNGEVAAALGVSRHTVYVWKQGTTMPSDENFRALAKLMGRNVYELRLEWQRWSDARPAL